MGRLDAEVQQRYPAVSLQEQRVGRQQGARQGLLRLPRAGLGRRRRRQERRLLSEQVLRLKQPKPRRWPQG